MELTQNKETELNIHTLCGLSCQQALETTTRSTKLPCVLNLAETSTTNNQVAPQSQNGLLTQTGTPRNALMTMEIAMTRCTTKYCVSYDYFK